MSTASILLPTRDRPGYLRVALASLAPQAQRADAELIVVDDGTGGETERIGAQFGAQIVRVPSPGGLNRARNAGIAAASSEFLIFVDDDVRAPEGWLEAMLAGADASPDHDVFGGPIHAALEGGGPRSCGREGPPITHLDLGPRDRDADVVWGANMAIRRRALETAGGFDPTLSGPGDEEEWERRLRAGGGRIRYLAAAGLDHRRTPTDSRLGRLTRASYRAGRATRRFDARSHRAPSLGAETRTLLGCAAHVIRYRCPNMIAVGAHSAGRLHEALRERVSR